MCSTGDLALPVGDGTCSPCADTNALLCNGVQAIECQNGKFLDLLALTCITTCSETELNAYGGAKLCRTGSIIYVDSTSAEPFGLGTMDIPYKTLEDALGDF